jgi:hypothetical protein
MSCKNEQIKRNWDYGYTDEQNWFWPRLKAVSMNSMIDAFSVNGVTLEAFLKRVEKNLYGYGVHNDVDNDEPITNILMAKTEDGEELSSGELETFKRIATRWGGTWVIVNEKKVAIEASDCSYIGKIVG